MNYLFSFFLYKFLLFMTVCLSSFSCQSRTATTEDEPVVEAPKPDDAVPESPEKTTPPEKAKGADITKVEASGGTGAYTFSVTIKSPETGCDKYANWWLVADMDGNVLYTRILGHSHVGEQPFTRSGGTVKIEATTEVYVVGHMNDTGYNGVAMKGNVGDGFKSATLPESVLKRLNESKPTTPHCAFQVGEVLLKLENIDNVKDDSFVMDGERHDANSSVDSYYHYKGHFLAEINKKMSEKGVESDFITVKFYRTPGRDYLYQYEMSIRKLIQYRADWCPETDPFCQEKFVPQSSSRGFLKLE